MTEDFSTYNEMIKKDCDTCGRPKVGQVCPMPEICINACLGSPSRPFWRPKSGAPCGVCDYDDGNDIKKCVECDGENSNFALKPETENKYDPKSRYYDHGGIEVLKIIKAKLTPEQYQGFCLGNAIKYTCRANHKGDYQRDLEKAEFYAREAR